jgi:putative ABC transport system permease protein
VGKNSSYGKIEEPVYLGLMKNFLANEKKVDVTLMILQVPVLVLLCAFLYMISHHVTLVLHNHKGKIKGKKIS